MDPSSLQPLLPLFSAISLLIATVALLFTAYNSIMARRNSENSALLEMWEKYDRLCLDLEGIKSGKGRDIAFIRLLNYVENICFLYNRRRVSPQLRRNIRNLVADFAAMTDAAAPLDSILAELSSGPETYEEIGEFRRRHRDMIEGRRRWTPVRAPENERVDGTTLPGAAPQDASS